MTGRDFFYFTSAGLMLYIAYKTTQTAGDIGEAVSQSLTEDLNPVNPDNIVNRGVTSVITELSGGQYRSLGDMLFQWFNDEPDFRVNPIEQQHDNNYLWEMNSEGYINVI